MESGIEGITRFQQERGLDKKEFYVLNEATNIVEELFESMGFDVPKARRPELMNAFMEFTKDCKDKGIMTLVENCSTQGQIDAFGDIIVFACGAITKLGYDPELVLREISKEINSRTGKIIDGKFEKDLSRKDEWYKADFKYCKLQAITPSDRSDFLNTEGYMAFDEDIKIWKNKREK